MLNPASRNELDRLKHGISLAALIGRTVRLGVWSRHLLERIEDESFWLGSPGFADEFVGCETFEGLESSAEVIGIDEVAEMSPELRMSVVVIAVNCGFLDGSVHPLDLSVGPRMVWLGQPMFDAIGPTDLVEAVNAISCGPTITISR